MTACILLLFMLALSGQSADLDLVIGEAKHRIPLGVSLEESLGKQHVLALDIPNLSCSTCINEKIKNLGLLCKEYNLGVIVFVRKGYNFQYIRNLQKLTGLEATFLVLERPAFTLSNSSGLISMTLFSKDGRSLTEPSVVENENCLSFIEKITEK